MADDYGLDWHYYGFRPYDAAIGRFPSIDPIADNFAFVSGYNYAENSPIRYIDLWGLQKWDFLHNLDGQQDKRMEKTRAAYEYIPVRNEQGVVIINNTRESRTHYFKGKGEDVVLGEDVKETLRTADRVNRARNSLESGSTLGPAAGGVLTVDVTWEGAFFVGRIGLSYQTTCNDNSCTTTFTLDDNGFVDPNFLVAWWNADNEGSNAEIMDGIPYDFEPFIWEETYDNPGYPVDENGVPSPIPLVDESGNE